MKKFFVGLACGAALSAATAVYASENIQAYLFPVKFIINGEDKTPSGSIETLNYNGSAYVPVRYLAESLGSAVIYDNPSQTITIDNRFTIVDANNPHSKAGFLSVLKEGNRSKINGKLYIGHGSWDHKFIDAMKSMNPTVDYSKTQASGTLVFWNAKGEILEKVPYEIPDVRNQSEQIVNFEAFSQKDITGYAAVTLEQTKPSPRPFFDYKEESTFRDNESKVTLTIMNVIKTGEYTLVRAGLQKNNASVTPDSLITLTFFDDNGNTLGSARTTLGEQSDVMYAIFLGKGDFTPYKSVKIEVSG
ncbi:stalk domain-containing protein [Paenibacillus sp. GbtcB18]|uniref:stalk domain-containing protein n=1 Tax=Paenibacillus sp. GbtcB18 TaxID=2824763 RepID=UPI001C2FAD3E|nr:stalk domain-containing protein [Paenibacillus sp. GbtcB18]